MNALTEGSAVVSRPVELSNDIPRVAAPETELVESIDLAVSTYRACIRGGRGPRTFKIGRRNFVLIEDWNAWLRQMAETGGLTAGLEEAS
jgi:hypothetical protein